jgi:AcrR family transcriptional regulator
MRKRAENVDATRQRIVEAAAELHGSVGPAATTVQGIAERAGVTRATVYRHFPDDDALFAACSAHWLAGQRPPDPASWAAVRDPRTRLRVGLADIYRFYRDGEAMLRRVYGDFEHLPGSRRREIEARDAAIRDLLVAPYEERTKQQPVLRAVVAHATSFWTWRSLCIDGGLGNEQAVDLMVGLAETARAPSLRSARGGAARTEPALERRTTASRRAGHDSGRRGDAP